MTEINEEKYNKKVKEFAEGCKEYKDKAYAISKQINNSDLLETTDDALQILMLTESQPHYQVYENTDWGKGYNTLVKEMAHSAMHKDVKDEVMRG
jgi:hypothetical protein